MSWFLRPLVYGAEKIFKDFLKKLLGDFVELHNFKLEPLQGGFTGTLDGLHLKVAEINTLLGDIPLTLESGIIAKASVEISVKRECRLHLDGVELHFLVGADAMVRIKQEAKAEDLTRSTTEGKYQRQSDSEDDDDDDSEAESEGEAEDEDGEKRGGAHKEMVTFTVLKEKIKEILRRVERVDVSNVHVLLSTKEGKGKQELHLHFNHLRYEDATQPESAPVPSPTTPARGIPGAGSMSEEEEIKIESSKVVKWLEVEGLKVMVEEFYKHKEGDEEMLEIRPTKLLEISTVPQRNYSRMGDAKERSEDEDKDDEENGRGLKGKKRETGDTRPTKNLSGRLQINLTVGQTVVVEEVDMAFDHHRIDVIIPPKYLRFLLDLADRFNAQKSADDVSAATTTTPTTTDHVERPSHTANAGLSVPVYAFPKCTLHVNRGSVILLEEDMPSPNEGHAVGASIKMDTSQSNEREMFTANSSSAMIADSVSQLDFVPFDRVPRFSWSFERASIALSSRMLPPPPPIAETLPSPLASGYYSPHSSLTPPPAAPFVRPLMRVPPPSSALLVDIRMRDCDLVEFVYEHRAHSDDGVESEDEDDDRRKGSREVRFDLIRLGVKEEADEEGEEDGEDDISVNDDGELDSRGGGEGIATLVGDERFLIRFEKKVRIEEREIEASPPQTSFDNIDAEELAGIGVPPPPSSRTNSNADQLWGEPPRSDSSTALDNSELMVWEETKLTMETARLNIETDTKITERLQRLMNRLSAPPVAPAPETLPPPTWEEFLKEQARKEAEQRTREEAVAESGNRPFENWSIQRNFFIDVGARKKLRATIHFYDAHGRRRKEKLDVLLFDTDKIKFSTCISSFDSSDQGLCAAFQDATILEFDFENIMATITSRLGYPKAPFFRASMADTHGDRVTPLEITLKPPTSLQTNDENIVGEMTALVGKKGRTFASVEVERMNHFKYLTSQLAGVAIKIRFPFSEIELEKYDYDAILAILDNLSAPAPPPVSPPPPVTEPSTASSPSHVRLSPSTSPNRGVSFLENKAARYRLDASTIVEVTLTHANLKLLESRGKASDESAKTKQSTHKPFHLHFVDVERLNIFFAGARFNEKPSNWLSVDADNFLLYERLMSASRSSVYTPATLVVNRNPFVTSAATARPVFSSLFLLTGADDGVKNRMDFNDLIIHHKAGFQWYNHLGTFFSSEEQAVEQKAEDRKEKASYAAEGPRTEGSEASVTQFFINLPNLELEYTPTLVPGNAFITTGYLQVDLMLYSGRKEPTRVADIPRLELNIVAKPRKVSAGRNIAIYIAKSSAEEDDGDAADVDDNEMARQKRLHWRSNGKRYLKAGVLNSAFSVRLKSRLVDDEDHFLRLLRACGQPTLENEHESDGVSGIDLRRFCDDASMQHSVGGDGTPGSRSRKRTMGQWMTKLTLCQYDVNDDKSKTEENVRPFLLGFCADSLSTFVDIFNEALLPADLVLADIDPDAQAKRDEMAQQQRLRKEREEKRRAAMKRKQDEQQRKARSERGNQSSREGTAELTGGSSSVINSREGSGADGLEVSRIHESLPPEIAEKIRKQDEIRIEEARRRDRGRRSRSSSLTGNGDAEKKDKIHVSEARLQNGIWYTDPRKMQIIPDYWHTPGDRRLLPDPASISSFCVAVKSGLSINLRLYSGLDWPALAHAAPKETILDRQMDSFFEVRLNGLKLRFDEFLRQPLFPRRMALAVHDLTVVDRVGPAQRGKVDFFAHNKKKDRLAETAMLYFTLTCHKKDEKIGGGNGTNDESDDEMDVNPDEEYWQGALEMPAPLRIKVHENVLKLLLFSHHPFFPLATTELPTTPPMLIRGFRVGPLVAKIDWSGWSYSDELLAALTPENLGGIIVDRNTLVGYGVFLSGYKALTAISLRWGERQFSGLYYGWGELVGKIVELYAIDVVTRKPHKVIGAIGGIRHVKEAVRMGSEAIAANLPAMPVSVPLPDVYAIGEYINSETIGSALEYASSVTSYLSSQALSSSSSFVSSVYAQAAQLALSGLQGAPAQLAIGPGSSVPPVTLTTKTTKKARVGRQTKPDKYADEENSDDEGTKSVKGKERIQSRRSHSEDEDDDNEVEVEMEVEVEDEEPKVRVFGGDDDESRRPAALHSYDDDDEEDYSGGDGEDDSYDERDQATTARERQRQRESERRAVEAEEQRRRREKLARREREDRERIELEAAAEAQRAERLRRQDRGSAKRESERKAASPAKSAATNKVAKLPTKPPKKKPASYSDDNGSDDDFSMEWKD